ncbi:hypothetical protein QWY93_11290 [Echinicola jeungdonensis]|uniref:Protein BatD n=1 Tax=Echinicola jeungdonensis TaxID=709343 RepID=A0ABV5J881_9BACT|nr:hypothetical protein [Echinicola jeungdonensis]MDN3669909.1 hypothetical protein [Echinicola jeungdonensis]
MGKSKVTISLLLILFSTFVSAQEKLKVEGYFLEDSAKLGEKVGYVLKASYPSDLNIVFPDSTFQYEDFSFLDKETFTSFTQDSITLDSAVYYLSNFSLDSVKSYALPVFEILRYDSISHFAPEDQLVLKFTIDPMPQELVFKENNNYLHLDKAFNYPVLAIVIGGLVLVTVLVLVIFGKNIRKKWSIRKLKKQHALFAKKWKNTVETMEKAPSLQVADELLWLWKDYMGNLTGQPYPEWTSTEIGNYLEKPGLVKDFRKIEIIIYAGKGGENLQMTCDKLQNICNNLYQQKIEEIRERK